MLRMEANALMSTGVGVAFGLFEQQRGAALLDGAVGEFGDLEDRDRLQTGCASARDSLPARG